MWSAIAISRPGPDLGAQRAGRVGDQQRLGAGRAQRAHRARASRAGVAALVDVRAALQAGHRQPAERARARAGPPWPATPGAREAGQLGVGDRDGVLERVGEPAEPGAEHDPQPRRVSPRAAIAAAAARASAHPVGQVLRAERARQQLARASRSSRAPAAPHRWTVAVERHELAQPLAAAAARHADARRRRRSPPPRRSRVRPAATSAPIADASAHWPCG